MKKFLLPLSIAICFLFSFNEKTEAQYVTIPDTAFVNWLNASGYSACMTGNQLDTTCPDLSAIGLIDLTGNINDTYGLQFMSNISELDINYTLIDSIFYMPQMGLASDLNLSNNPNLKYFNLAANADVHWINLDSCAFTELPTFSNSLETISCSYNFLTSISNMPSNVNSIVCQNNSLTDFSCLCGSLEFLAINDNPNLQCLNLTTPFLYEFYFGNTALACLPHFDSVDVSVPDYNSFPICAIFNPYGCATLDGVAGTIFNDSNSNCSFDSGESLIGGIPVRLYSNGTFVQQDFTNNLGTYSFFTPQTGTYTVSIDTSLLPFNIICPTSGADTAIISLTDTLDNDNDFSLNCNSISDGVVSSVVNDSSFFHPDGKCLVSIFAGDIFSFYNTNCFGNLSGTVTATFSGPVSYYGVKAGSLVPTVTGNTLTWSIADFNTVDPYHDFHVRFITDTSAALGSAVCINATISINQTDANALNNSASNCFVVQTSFDPNYKEVNPASLTYQPIPLTYTIHFQNTGTAAANNIFILDTLDSELDLNTFRFLGASHYCIPQILQGGILRFNFPNINLPDSNSNEPASHGWVQYSIEQSSDIDPMTVIIENTANIYFDFNSAVVTNTTVTPFSEGIEEHQTASDFILYPNPASTELTLILRQAQHDNYIIEIKDALGRKVFSKTAEQRKQSINISSLPSGIYFVEVFSRDGYSPTKKLVVVK